MAKIKLQLPTSLISVLNYYEKDGFIELNKFIENSIQNHIEYIKTGQKYNKVSPTVELDIHISIFLILKLWWKALITKTSVSKIVNEALSFSIPALLDELQAQEDCRLEVELPE